MLFCANCCFLALPRSNRRNLTDRAELAFYLGQSTKFGVYGSSAASAASGCTGLLKGGFGAAIFWAGMGQLERALAAKRKSTRFQWSTRTLQLISIDSSGAVHSRGDLLRQYSRLPMQVFLNLGL